jgi:hypothetical protein
MSSILSKAPSAARVSLGLAFIVFGLNGFFHFLPAPPPPAPAMSFLGGLASSGYFFPLLKGTEIAAGALLLANRFVPLALTVLAPILVNIVAYHLALAPSGAALPLLLVALEIYLAFSYRASFRGVLAAHAGPSSTSLGAREPVEAAAE